MITDKEIAEIAEKYANSEGFFWSLKDHIVCAFVAGWKASIKHEEIPEHLKPSIRISDEFIKYFKKKWGNK